MIQIDGETYDISREKLRIVAATDTPLAEPAERLLKRDESIETRQSVLS